MQYSQFLSKTEGKSDLSHIIKYWLMYDADNCKEHYLKTVASKDKTSLNQKHCKTRKAVHWICTLIVEEKRPLLTDVKSKKWLHNITTLIDDAMTHAGREDLFFQFHTLRSL